MPIDYDRYPKNWKRIRNEILERCKNRCECRGECGKNHGTVTDTTVHRLRTDFTVGEMLECSIAFDPQCREMHMQRPKSFGGKRVVLTIAHTNHSRNPKCAHRDKLKAMCQACHLRFDRNHKTNKEKAMKKAIAVLAVIATLGLTGCTTAGGNNALLDHVVKQQVLNENNLKDKQLLAQRIEAIRKAVVLLDARLKKLEPVPAAEATPAPTVEKK